MDIKFSNSNGKNGIRLKKMTSLFLLKKRYKTGKTNNIKYSKLERLNIWINNWLTIFINEDISKPKLGLIPNLPACLITLAFSPPKWGIRKNAIETNQKIEKLFL